MKGMSLLELVWVRCCGSVKWSRTDVGSIRFSASLKSHQFPLIVLALFTVTMVIQGVF